MAHIQSQELSWQNREGGFLSLSVFAEYCAIKYQRGNVNLCFLFLFSKESRFIKTLQVLVRLESHKYIYNVIYFLIKKNLFQSRNLVLMSSLRLQGGAAVSTVSSQQDSCGFNPEAQNPNPIQIYWTAL